jgi:hypothetical protein
VFTSDDANAIEPISLAFLQLIALDGGTLATAGYTIVIYRETTMKLPWEWDESDLLALITAGARESVQFEFKQCDALAKTDGKRKEVSKDVSAFANSAGGTIVYGMIENGHVATALDGGYDPDDITKEWLDQVINSCIQRRIDGVRIRQVELRTHAPGRVAYVVCVPQSTRAPHQAADKRFYKRYNFESQPMEEYEIRDVARRAESPNLSLAYNITPTGSTPPTWVLRPVIKNDAATPARYIVIALLLDAKIEVHGKPAEVSDDGLVTAAIDGTPCQLRRLTILYGGGLSNFPIFEGPSFNVLSQGITVGLRDAGHYLLAWELRSPSMTPKCGSFILCCDGMNATIQGS